MARNPALLGFGNYPNVVGFASTLVTTSAAYEAPSLKAIRLKTAEPSEIARILTTNPLHSYFGVQLGGTVPTPRALTGFALIHSNLSPTGQVRFLGHRSSPAFVAYAPTAIAAPSNITGAVTAVDEALDAPDANFIDPTVTTQAWSARFTFPTPAETPAQGEDMAFFALRMLLVDGGDLTAHPVVTVSLYENGGLMRQLGSRPVSVSTGDGQLFYFPFDPAELAGVDLNAVEVLVQCSRGVGTGPTYARLNTVSVVIEDDSQTNGLPDSGWIDSPTAARPEYEGLPALFADIDYFPTGAAMLLWDSVPEFVVLIRDDQATHNPQVAFGGIGGNYSPVGNVVRQPPGHVDAGVLLAGQAKLLTYSPKLGPESYVRIEGYEGVTEGGQTYGADAFHIRGMRVDLTLTRSEKDELLDGIDWRRGSAQPIYVSLDRDLSAESSLFTKGWVTAVETGPALQVPDLAYSTGDEMLFNKAYTFEEKL